MSDPVMAADGCHSYERKQIERWLATKQVDEPPMTGEARGAPAHAHLPKTRCAGRSESGKNRIERFRAYAVNDLFFRNRTV